MRINEILSKKLNRTGSIELVIFDIDDTLLHTTAKINVVKDGEVVRSLTNQEFNNYKLQPGEEFDFGEFRNAAKFEEESVPIGPMLDQLRSDLASGKNVVMLTARSDFDNQKAVWRTFKRHGIDINKDVHLYRAGNQPGSGSPAVKKAIHVIQWLKTGKYNRVTMYDDSEKNLTVFKSLEEKFPNVEFAAHHVNDEGGTKQLEGWSEKYKRSINCASPKGFSQRAHCQGRKKNEDVAENFADGQNPQVKESINKATLKESKSAPLYHFTTWDNLISILSSNQLTSPSGKIYLTRDYTRQFIPHAGEILKQPYGIRIDQELLSRDYGRKLQAGGQDIGWDEKKRQAWLANPKNAREIEKVKQTGRGSGSRYDGADPEDIIKGTVRQSRRWESEEHLNVKNLPNLDKYITGIVIGSAPIGSKHFSQEINPDPLTKLADILINLFSGPKGFDQRNLFLDLANKLNVPIVYERKGYSPEQVKKRIIQLYSQRKKDRESEQAKAQNSFLIITSPAGGGIATSGSDINAAFKKLSINPKYRDIQIYGYSIGYGPDADKKMFDNPVPLLQLVKEPIKENFADGRNPQDKGDSKRHGVPTKASVSTLRKVAKQGGRKGQLAHWMANMKAGRAKAKKN